MLLQAPFSMGFMCSNYSERSGVLSFLNDEGVIEGSLPFGAGEFLTACAKGWSRPSTRARRASLPASVRKLATP
jgi:hypothetical protein